MGKNRPYVVFKTTPVQSLCNFKCTTVNRGMTTIETSVPILLQLQRILNIPQNVFPITHLFTVNPYVSTSFMIPLFLDSFTSDLSTSVSKSVSREQLRGFRVRTHLSRYLDSSLRSTVRIGQWFPPCTPSLNPTRDILEHRCRITDTQVSFQEHHPDSNDDKSSYP